MKRRCRVDPDSAFLRRSVAALTRLRSGWRPNKSMLADARHAEHWLVIRRDDTTGYQFIGFPPRAPEQSSMFIATVLAIDPAAGWALLAGGDLIKIGEQLPTQSPLEPADLVRCAAAWLRDQAPTAHSRSCRVADVAPRRHAMRPNRRSKKMPPQK
jgi:hypothetical protein